MITLPADKAVSWAVTGGSDGAKFAISSGAAAGVANNDFEVAPNSFAYDLEAGDANGSSSAPAASPSRSSTCLTCRR